MRSIALPKYYKVWRLVAFCFFAMMAAVSITFAQGNLRMENSRAFWVSDFKVNGASYRQAQASLRASGNRSVIYVEDKLWEKGQSPDFVNGLLWRLENTMPDGAVTTDMGIVPYEESLFGSLPRVFGGDERLIVLITDIESGRRKVPDAAFSNFDQLRDADAQKRYQQHSNEANIVYLNGFRRSESASAGAIARELQLLLAHGNSISERESWLSETLAEGAMLLTGHFAGQSHVNALAKDSGEHPLVSFAAGKGGSQLLFSSFLLDSLSGNGAQALAAISRGSEPGKGAVERVFRDQTGVPLTFDAIFSNYVSYVFTHSNHGDSLPQAWSPKNGIQIPQIEPYFTYKAGSGELVGQIPAYAFLAIDLAQELSQNVVIHTERVEDGSPKKDPTSCAHTASVLWKPIESTRIAVYAVGCEPKVGEEQVGFRLKIVDIPTGR